MKEIPAFDLTGAATNRIDSEIDVLDPMPIVKSLLRLFRIYTMYPEGHPIMNEAAGEIDGFLAPLLQDRNEVRVDIIHGEICLNGKAHQEESIAAETFIRQLADLGLDSLHFLRGVDGAELLSLAKYFALRQEGGTAVGTVGDDLANLGVRNVRVGRLVPLDSAWRFHDWPDAPGGALDPAYTESLARAEETFDSFDGDRAPDVNAIRGLVRLLVNKVATSKAALGTILGMKHYENYTYCHSVNVAVLSVLLGRRIGLSEAVIANLMEAGLMHDIGKIRTPMEILKKQGPLNSREWKIIQWHPRLGAEMLVGVEGLAPLTPKACLEHHLRFDGGGYPDLGDEFRPHHLSQIISVADKYEALTGARSYRNPAPPEQACLILARMAGTELNPALVRAFISTVTFFPVGTPVRTDRGEVGVVVGVSEENPLHPRIMLAKAGEAVPSGTTIDTAEKDRDGGFVRHIVESLSVDDERVDVQAFLSGMN